MWENLIRAQDIWTMSMSISMSTKNEWKNINYNIIIITNPTKSSLSTE